MGIKHVGPVSKLKSQDIMIQDYNNHSVGNLNLKGPPSHRYNPQSKRNKSVPRVRAETRQESGLDRSHPLASSIVSMTNLDDSTNALIVPRDFSQSILGPGKATPYVSQRGTEPLPDDPKDKPMLTPEGLLNQINQDNDVELTTTLWKVLRNQEFAKDNELFDFAVSHSQARHAMRVGDVVKFGRVNFKVCALRCKNKLREDIQGGYYLLEKKQKNDQEMIEELQQLERMRTEKNTVAGVQVMNDKENKEVENQMQMMAEDTPGLMVRKGRSRI